MKQKINNPWVVCLSAATFFFYQYIQLTSFNVLKPFLMHEFNVGSSTLGIISSLYFYGVVLFLIPAGILLDRISTRLILLVSMLLSLLGLLLFAYADSIYTAGLGRFIVGVCGGPFCFLGIIRLASRWFSARHLALVTGLIVSIGMLGGIIAQTPVSLLLEHMGWREVMWLNIWLGVAITILLYFLVYDYPIGKNKEYKQQLAYYKANGLAKGLKTVMTRSQNWYCAIFASLLNLPIFLFGALCGIMYLTKVHQLGNVQASLVCSMLFVGMLIGSPVFGYISDKLRLRKVPMLVGVIICLFSMVSVAKSAALPLSTLICLFFAIGFGSSAQILAFPLIAEINELALTASASSLASTAIMLGGAFFQPLVGCLIDSAHNLVLWLNVLAIILSGCFVLLIRETYCKRKLAN